MNSTIEVFDGSTWVQIFAMQLGVAITDDAWTQQSFDVTAYKNASVRVRWGWQVGMNGVLSSLGWNVDDVRLFPTGCP